MSSEVRTRTDAVVWVADGTAAEGLDYGRRLEERLARRGLDVSRRYLESDETGDSDARLHVLTGGATSVNRRAGWMPAALAHTRRLVRRAEASGSRIVGVCLGAQMIAESLWPGSVRSGERIEVGLCEVSWHVAGQVRDAVVPAFHYEEIDPEAVIGGGGRIVAANPHSAVQGFRVGESVAGVQFHPELTPSDVRALVAHHAPTINEYGGDPDAALASVDRWEASWSADAFDWLLDELGVAQVNDLTRRG
jgi:GMP synthase-like glutamine amidotransferase